MRTTRSSLTLIAGLALATLAAPRSAAASDCGGEYVACLAEAEAIGTSDAMHETECYGDYLSCTESQLRFF